MSPPARRTRSARPPETSLEEVLYQVKRVIVGQDVLLERMLIVLLAKGHLLVEGVPGLAKTLAVKTLAGAIGCEFQRVQFTPDLVPADIVGTRIYNQKMGEFQVALGPIFANLVLADEINRAPAKVQSALLEVMAERQVSIGGQTRAVPAPLLVTTLSWLGASRGARTVPTTRFTTCSAPIPSAIASYDSSTRWRSTSGATS